MNTEKKISLNQPIEEFLNDAEASVRLNNVVTWLHGVKTLRDLLELDWRYLLKTRNCGRKTMRELRDLLTPLGLSLQGEFPFAERTKRGPTPSRHVLAEGSNHRELSTERHVGTRRRDEGRLLHCH